MSPFGVPMIGWVWAGRTLVVGGLWAREHWQGQARRTGDAADTAVLGAAGSGSVMASAAPRPIVRSGLPRSPARRETGDAMEVLRRMYGRKRP